MMQTMDEMAEGCDLSALTFRSSDVWMTVAGVRS